MPETAADLAEAVIDLGRLALAFGRIDRTACRTIALLASKENDGA